MNTKESRAVIVLDDIHSRCTTLRVDVQFSLRQQGYEPETLAQCEAALDAFDRASTSLRVRLEQRVTELRECKERGRALTCVAPLPLENHG